MFSSDDNIVDDLIVIRKKAEEVVEGMAEGPLKVAAFEKAFESLSAGPQDPPVRKRSKRRSTPKKSSTGRKRKKQGPKAHTRDLIEDGFFSESRTAPEVVAELLVGGHKYDDPAVGTALARLTRDKELRRHKESRGESGNDVWVYEQY